uniref:Lipoprotein n=1 Tax=uncultured Spirochaetaceae bacterium TaxID=201186 RepID=A0A650EPF1_9SPIO|nr:hypothetical protein Unknown280_1480 [uncultured Spirochaetaceae bacterium]
MGGVIALFAVAFLFGFVACSSGSDDDDPATSTPPVVDDEGGKDDSDDDVLGSGVKVFAFDTDALRDKVPNAFDEMADADSSVTIIGNTFTAKDAENGAAMRINYIFENADEAYVIKDNDVLKLAFSMDNNAGANFSILFYDTKQNEEKETIYDSAYIGWTQPKAGAEQEIELAKYAGKKLRGFEFCTNDGCKELKVTKMKIAAAGPVVATKDVEITDTNSIKTYICENAFTANVVYTLTKEQASKLKSVTLTGYVSSDNEKVAVFGGDVWLSKGSASDKSLWGDKDANLVSNKGWLNKTTTEVKLTPTVDLSTLSEVHICVQNSTVDDNWAGYEGSVTVEKLVLTLIE